MKKCLGALAFAIVAIETFATVNVFTWKGEKWARYDDSANWTVGTLTGTDYNNSGANPDSKLPGELDATDHIYPANMYFDMNGGSHSVQYWSKKEKSGDAGNAYTIGVSNGTFSITTGMPNRSHLSVWNDGILDFPATLKHEVNWGHAGVSSIDIHSGGRWNVLCTEAVYHFYVTVDDGGVIYWAPKSFYPNQAENNQHYWIKNSGTFEAPNGICWTGSSGNYKEDAHKSFTVYQLAGTMSLGGMVSRNGKSKYPFYFEATGGTLKATGGVTFLDLSGASLSADADLTVETDEGASFDFSPFTYGANAKVTKTGAGTLRLGAAVPSVTTVNAGWVSFGAQPESLDGFAFATGTGIEFSCATGVTIDSLEGYENIDFSVDTVAVPLGVAFFSSSDAGLRARVVERVNANFAGAYEVKTVGNSLSYAAVSDYVFDPSKADSLETAAGWKFGEVPPAGAEVFVRGAGTADLTVATRRFARITVDEGATLEVTGGTDEIPVELPAVTLQPGTRLRFAEDSRCLMTNEFAAVASADALPVFEVATNASVRAQSPNLPDVKNENDSVRPNPGFSLKNVALRWYGNIRLFKELSSTSEDAYLTIGTANPLETGYIAIDCQGGTYTAVDSYNSAVKNHSKVRIVQPESTGRVKVIGQLLFRDFKRIIPEESGLYQSGYCFGVDNPTNESFEVVVDGTTQMQLRGVNRIAGGCTVIVRGKDAKLIRPQTTNDNGNDARLNIYERGRLVAEDGAGYGQQPTSSAGGLRYEPSEDDWPVLTMSSSARSQVWVSGGNGKGFASVSNAFFDVGQLYPGNSSGDTGGSLANQTSAFNGLKSVRIEDGGTLWFRATDIWKKASWWTCDDNWNRVVKMGPPLTGAGNLSVTNALTGTLAEWTMTAIVTNGANTATGTATTCSGDSGAESYLLFNDGANWAGTVVSDGHVALTNVAEGATAATVSFNALRLDEDFPIRVWKTGGSVVANDRVNLSTALTGSGRLSLVAVDEVLTSGDTIAVGTYPASAALPKIKGCTVSAEPIPGDDERVTLTVTRGIGLMLLVR